MPVIHAPEKPSLDARVLVFPIGLSLLFLGFFFRLWYIQVVRADDLRRQAEQVGTLSIRKLAPRGLIVDRKGELLAGVRPEIVVTAKPAVVRQNAWVLEKLAGMLAPSPDKAPAELKALTRKVEDGAWRPYMPAPIKVGVPMEVAIRIAESAADLPGIGVETQPMRYYPQSEAFTHLLGYVWVPDTRDVDRLKEMGLTPPDYVGKFGVEYVYERELMGKPGAERVDIDNMRRILRTVGRDSATPGEKLVLSVDGDLQRYATELLKGHQGAVVAIDPRDGGVLCMASGPTYSLDLFYLGISNKDYASLSEDPYKPMLNRAIGAFYSPGSTFKIVTTLAMQQQGIFDPHATVHCPGYYKVGTRTIGCLGRHGAISYQRALERSCNTYFAEMGTRCGVEALRKASLDVGLGGETGVDLRGELKGIVPTAEWIAKHRSDGRWYGGDTVNFSIGQGELSTSPLQMANVMALIANRGVGYQPHLVRAVQAPGEEPIKIAPKELHRLDLPESFWGPLHQALLGVVEHGTASRSKIAGIRMGGKTGSTEHGGRDPLGRRVRLTHSWFVCFAPVEDPKIAVCVLAEAAGHGSDIAAPIASKIVQRYLQGPPQNAEVNAAPSVSASSAPASSPRAR